MQAVDKQIKKVEKHLLKFFKKKHMRSMHDKGKQTVRLCCVFILNTKL